MRGTLACVLQWRLGALPAFPPEVVLAADLADREERRSARRNGFSPKNKYSVHPTVRVHH